MKSNILRKENPLTQLQDSYAQELVAQMPRVRAIELAERISNYDDGMFADDLIELLAGMLDERSSRHSVVLSALRQAFTHTEAFDNAFNSFMEGKYEQPVG